LPRMGSSAWYSESRAERPVPSAESPSTMNSSERSKLFDRQSTSLVGNALVSNAFLRRTVSLCRRAATRALAAATTFSSTAVACALSARLVDDKIRSEEHTSELQSREN